MGHRYRLHRWCSAVTICTICFNIKRFCIFVFTCTVRLFSRPTAITFLNRIKGLVFVMQTDCVACEVENESLYTILLDEFHDSQTDRQTDRPSDASCWCQEFFNVLRIKTSRLNWVGCTTRITSQSRTVHGTPLRTPLCTPEHKHPATYHGRCITVANVGICIPNSAKICWPMYCRILMENGRTDRQTVRQAGSSSRYSETNAPKTSQSDCEI